MRSQIPAARTRFVLKASHSRLSLRCSHRRDGGAAASGGTRDADRERYIAPPKRRR